MQQSLIYDTQKEKFWFPVPEQTKGRIGLNYGMIVASENLAPDMKSVKDFLFPYI